MKAVKAVSTLLLADPRETENREHPPTHRRMQRSWKCQQTGFDKDTVNGNRMAPLYIEIIPPYRVKCFRARTRDRWHDVTCVAQTEENCPFSRVNDIFPQQSFISAGTYLHVKLRERVVLCAIRHFLSI